MAQDRVMLPIWFKLPHERSVTGMIEKLFDFCLRYMFSGRNINR